MPRLGFRGVFISNITESESIRVKTVGLLSRSVALNVQCTMMCP